MSTEQETDTQVVETPAAVETPSSETPETPENEADEKVAAEGEQPKAEDEPEKPKRESGYDRMKRKNQFLQSEILRLQQVRETPEDTDKAPREEDFNGDWGKYIAATAAYEAAKAVKGSLASDRKAAGDARLAELRQEVLEDFNERASAFKAKATDFDTVVSKFVESGGKFSDALRELVTDSDVGPQLTYHLAKNPAIASRLNALSPLQAAKEIGKLEDTLSRPPNRTTKAPPPLKTPSGGANHSSSEDAQVEAMLKSMYG